MRKTFTVIAKDLDEAIKKLTLAKQNIMLVSLLENSREELTILTDQVNVKIEEF